jgi:AraC-like DNA-binding protein
LRVVGVGPVRLAELAMGPAVFRRTEEIVSAERDERALFVVGDRGTVTLTQRDRAVELGPGDLSLLEPLYPCTAEFSPGSRSFTIHVPRHAIAMPTRTLIDFVATALPADPIHANVVDIVRHVFDGGIADASLAGSALGNGLVGLMTAALAGSRGAVQPSTGLLDRVQRYIDQHLWDPDLSPPKIANEHHISLRYLHRLFEDDPMTVAELIRHRRLEGIRRDLEDPAMSGMAIADIGARWGLMDASRLSQSFRREFGVAPSEYRRARL